MQTLAPWTEQWQHFVSDVREQFWGDLAQHTRQCWQDLLGRLSVEARDRYLGVREYERSPRRTDARNGFYERDFGTRLGTLRVRVARTRQRAFLPPGLARLERRAAEVLLLIREAFLRGLSTRAVGRVVALVTEEPVSAQTVSRVTRDLDQAVAQFHAAPLGDAWQYLFLDGVSLRVRRPSGRNRVQLLVAYGVRTDGRRQLLAFTRSQGESQAAWEGLLTDLSIGGA
jgi:putative transposase